MNTILACGCAPEVHDVLKGADLSVFHIAKRNVRNILDAQAARTSFGAYVSRRRAKGDTIEVVEMPFVSGPYTRAKVIVNGTPRRLWRFTCSDTTPRGWKYA